MKAFLNFNGFTRMIDIPRFMPQVMIPMREHIDMFSNDPYEEVTMWVLTFNHRGHLDGGGEEIVTYDWDGVIPK